MNLRKKENQKVKKEFVDMLSSAIGATLSMSLFMRLMGKFKHKELRIINTLGTLFTGKENTNEKVSESAKTKIVINSPLHRDNLHFLLLFIMEE